MNIWLLKLEDGTYCVKTVVGNVYFGKTKKEALGDFFEHNLDELCITITETADGVILSELLGVVGKEPEK